MPPMTGMGLISRHGKMAGFRSQLVLLGAAFGVAAACGREVPPEELDRLEMGGAWAAGGQSSGGRSNWENSAIGGAMGGQAGARELSSGGAIVTGNAGAGGAVPGGVAVDPASAGGTATQGSGGIGGTAGAGGGSSAPKHAAVYSTDHVVVFELTLPEACQESLQADPNNYCEGALAFRATEGGTVARTLERVGVRLKGRASQRGFTQKAAFKIKVDEYVEGQRFYGLRRITLNNMVQDPSMMHERIGYRLFREAGVPAPLCNHARLYVNGTYFGLYANVETPDDEFFEQFQGADAGNLYDILDYGADLIPGRESSFELETNRSTSNNADLLALIQAVNGPAASFYEDAGRALDWSEWLSVGAMQAMIADWDGYFGAQNNYKLYHDYKSDRFLLIPWGLDQTFGITDSYASNPTFHLDYNIDGSSSERTNGVVFRSCIGSPSCWAGYLDAVESALALWERQDFPTEIAAMRLQLASAIAEDTRRECTDADMEQHRAGLAEFLKMRGLRVRDQLKALGRNPQ